MMARRRKGQPKVYDVSDVLSRLSVDDSMVCTDVGRKKPHMVFGASSNTIIQTKNLTDIIDILSCRALVLDVIFPTITEELAELLKKGVKVHRLARLSLAKKLGDMFNGAIPGKTILTMHWF